MDEIKVFKNIVLIGLYFLGFYLLYNYVFDRSIDAWGLFIIPVGTSIFGLISKYVSIIEKRKEKGFVVLKRNGLDYNDFNGSILSILIILYLEHYLFYWLIPFLLIDLILIYTIKKSQIYYFDEWSIKDLCEQKNNIKRNDIRSFILHPNKLEVSYMEEDEDEDDEGLKKLFIRRYDIVSPNSWHQFEKIMQEFELKTLEKETDVISNETE
ncbi:hypothetical protein [Asprobacillus argus]